MNNAGRGCETKPSWRNEDEQGKHNTAEQMAPFSALESGQPDSSKIRSILFWALVFQIRAILKNQGDSQKQLKRQTKNIKTASV